MINKFIITSFTAFGVTLSANNAQAHKDALLFGEVWTKEELKTAISDTTAHNVIDSIPLIIQDKETAIKVVEPVLFTIYVKRNILKQRPYKTCLTGNNRIISGTLPKGYLGGTFLIIVDATNSNIIRLNHGK